MAGLRTKSINTRQISGGITYDDLQVSISLAKLPAANFPTWDSITLDGFTTKLLSFDVNDNVDLLIQTTHSVKLSTIIDNHIHWTIAADEVGDEIAFEITGVAAGIETAFASIGTITSSDYVLQTNDAGKHKYLEIGEISAVNTTVSSCFIINLKRVAVADGTDASGKIAVIFNDCHVKQNTFGSLQEDSKK